MKFTIIIILLFTSAYIYSQTEADSTGRTSANNNNTVSKKNDALDEKGKDFEGKKEGMRRSKDVFVDKDGDGICDSRQGGMSFGKMRRRMGEGKSGPEGSGSGSGGYRYGGGGRK